MSGPGGMDDDEDYNAARGATIAQAAADGALFAERLAKAWKQHKDINGEPRCSKWDWMRLSNSRLIYPDTDTI